MCCQKKLCGKDTFIIVLAEKHADHGESFDAAEVEKDLEGVQVFPGVVVVVVLSTLSA